MAVVVSRELAAPETDMGVIGNTTPTEQTIAEPAPSMNDPATDVPVLEIDESAAGDLPAIDAAPANEPAPEEEDSADTDSGSDG